jgi:hypothetical protein
LLSFSNRQPSSQAVNFLGDCVKFDTRDVGATVTAQEFFQTHQ